MFRLATAALLALCPTPFYNGVRAQEEEEPELDDEVRPAPPSIGADVPLAYFGPAPSSVDKRLVGPVQLLRSGVIDEDLGTIELPLYTGYYTDGSSHYYILTDTTDESNAAALGLNHSPKLAFSGGGATTASLDFEKVILVNREGKVDFSPENFVVAGDEPTPFPPTSFGNGAVGDELYSPLVIVDNIGGSLWNAPIVASNVTTEFLNQFCDMDVIPEDMAEEAFEYLHPKVVTICPRDQTVKINLVPGFSFAKPILYLTMDSSVDLAAAFEDVTFAPRLSGVTVGGDDSAFSAVERLFATINGYSNSDLPANAPNGTANHPHRQGFYSVLRDEAAPLNVLGGIPTVATDYSPLWDLNIGEWTQEAVDGGIRTRLFDEFQILGLVQQGWITGAGGAPYASSGIIVNCPIAMRFL